MSKIIILKGDVSIDDNIKEMEGNDIEIGVLRWLKKHATVVITEEELNNYLKAADNFRAYEEGFMDCFEYIKSRINQ